MNIHFNGVKVSYVFLIKLVSPEIRNLQQRKSSYILLYLIIYEKLDWNVHVHSQNMTIVANLNYLLFDKARIVSTLKISLATTPPSTVTI